MGLEIFLVILLVTGALGGASYAGFVYYRKILREAKNYERGLKMVPLRIHLPPSSDDIEGNGRDARDVTEEALSQAQVMYNIIASTATKGFKSSVYGQRHVAFEIVASKGLIQFYVAVPLVMEDVVRQAVIAAYPSARLEQVEEQNLFNKQGKLSGTIGGEMSMKKSYANPIATYTETKRDAMQTLMNAFTTLGDGDGAGVQVLIRPAHEGWTKVAMKEAIDLRGGKEKKTGLAALGSAKDFAGALWKPPEANQNDKKPEDKPVSAVSQAKAEAIEEKVKHPGYETLIRVVASSNTAARSQSILKNLVSSFSLFEASGRNGLSFTVAKNIDAFTTSYILRMFPQTFNKTILNTVELATIFHLPDQKHTTTSQLQRQMSKQVDGPYQSVEKGILLGYNIYRGVKKQIRLGDVDRRRHTYIIGQTGTGKSKLLENLALQDMLDGKGFAFIDPHGDSAEALLGMVPKERVEDIIYFNPADMEFPVGLNLFEFEDKEQRDFLVQEAIAMLYRLYDPGHTGIIGPRYEHWFRNAALTIMSDPAGSSFIDIPQVFNDNEFAKSKLKYVTDQTVLDFWNKEMAQTSDYHKSEVLGWFVSKFGAFLSNEMMRNIIGQTKSGFNLRDIMDNKKILLVNLSKGRTGELNSQLLGMIFVMKFQAAAMGRANIPEDERQDFTLYVDEFQNFATDSFENILSEARKYRLNLVLANQFMTQLTDKIREAIIGNVGTIISGRIGVTDAELMVKKFAPVFDVEDITKLPNFEAIASVMINNVPSSPFSMALIPPLGKPNPQLADALRRLSAAKFGRSRGMVEQEIFTRLRAGDDAKKQRQQSALDSFKKRVGAGGAQGGAAPAAGGAAAPGAIAKPGAGAKPGSSTFLDEWLAKRRAQQGLHQAPAMPAQPSTPAAPQPAAPQPPAMPAPGATGTLQPPVMPPVQPGMGMTPPQPKQPEGLTDPRSLAPNTNVTFKPNTIGNAPDAAAQPTAADLQLTHEIASQQANNNRFTGVNYKQPLDTEAGDPTPQDAQKLDTTLTATEHEILRKKHEEERERANAAPAQPADTLTVNGPDTKQDEGDHLQEIDIDLRGNVHIVDDEENPIQGSVKH